MSEAYLSGITVWKSIRLEIQEIDALIAQIDNNTVRVKNLSKCGIAVSKSNGKDQYYWVDKLTQKRKYARVEEIGKLKKVAQGYAKSTLVLRMEEYVTFDISI